MKKVRIGTATGFYGDTIWPAIESVKSGELDYLCFDALSELTMAILQKDYQKDSKMGFTKDLEGFMKELLPHCVEKGVKILTNAGGINPHGAKDVVLRVLKELGLNYTVGVVTGDNLVGSIEELSAEDLLVNTQNNKRLDTEKRTISFANAYLGSNPLVDALKQGADIVISGRTTDAAQFAAPLIYEFGWADDEWDKLASGMAIGHLMECSGQAVGGNFSGDWRSLDLVNIGFPIAEVYENGEAVISKTPNSGGLVSKDTLKEQLLYEVHDPSNYILPEVIVNLTDTRLENVGKDLVRVYGTTGKPATDFYKALIGYDNGFMGEAIIGYSWPDALEKAQCASEIIVAHMEKANLAYEDIHISFLGYNSLHGHLSAPDDNLNEVYLRVAIHTKTHQEASQLGRLVPPLSLSGPPSSSGVGGIRRPRELLGICPILVPKSIVDPKIRTEVFYIEDNIKGFGTS